MPLLGTWFMAMSPWDPLLRVRHTASLACAGWSTLLANQCSTDKANLAGPIDCMLEKAKQTSLGLRTVVYFTQWKSENLEMVLLCSIDSDVGK